MSRWVSIRSPSGIGTLPAAFAQLRDPRAPPSHGWRISCLGLLLTFWLANCGQRTGSPLCATVASCHLGGFLFPYIGSGGPGGFHHAVGKPFHWSPQLPQRWCHRPRTLLHSDHLALGVVVYGTSQLMHSAVKVTVRNDTCHKVYWKLCACLRCNLVSHACSQTLGQLMKTPYIWKHGQYVINGGHEILFSLRCFIELRGIDAWSNLTVWLLWNHQVDSHSEGSLTLHFASFFSVNYCSCFILPMLTKGHCCGGLTVGWASWETDMCCSPGRVWMVFSWNTSANSVILGSLMAVDTTLFTVISLLIDTKPMRSLARKPRIGWDSPSKSGSLSCISYHP